MTPERRTNEEIAEILDEIAELLEAQDGNHFRVQAYRGAADSLRDLDSSASDVLEADGVECLSALPKIGEGIARAIAEIVETGGLGFLEKLRGRVDPESLLATVPGIGPRLGQKIHEELGIETLEELELAAHDGRLSRLPGFGRRRLRAVAESLAGRLGKRAQASHGRGDDAPVGEILDVDREYRDEASRGRLRRIAPRRFNPTGERWLPILHTTREHRSYTALYSNTERAHRLGRTHDWVVIFQEDGRHERQSTVVTETRGPLRGRRVVRGRESECGQFYERSLPLRRPPSPRRVGVASNSAE